MSKISEESARAFVNGESFKKDNTEVEIDKYNEKFGSNTVSMYLFNNLIAKREGSIFFISAAGHTTKTTKERLNDLPGVEIYQKNGLWYLNGEYWDGEWTQIR